MNRPLLAVAIEQRTRHAHTQVDAERKPRLDSLGGHPIPKGRLEDPFGRFVGKWSLPQHQTAVAFAVGEIEIVHRIVGRLVAVGPFRRCKRSVVKPHAVPVPPVQVHGHACLRFGGIGRVNLHRGGQVFFIEQRNPPPVGSRQHEDGGAAPQRGNHPLSLDLPCRDGSAPGLDRKGRHPRQQAEIGKVFGLNHGGPRAALALDRQQRHRPRIGGPQQRTGDRAVTAQLNRRKILALYHAERPALGCRRGFRPEGAGKDKRQAGKSGEEESETDRLHIKGRSFLLNRKNAKELLFPYNATPINERFLYGATVCSGAAASFAAKSGSGCAPSSSAF